MAGTLAQFLSNRISSTVQRPFTRSKAAYLKITSSAVIVIAAFSSLDPRPSFSAGQSLAEQARSHLEIGRQDVKAGRPGDAEKEFLRALSLDPRLGEVLLDLTKLHILHGAWRDAEQNINAYLKSHPESPLALGLAGEVRLRERDFGGAEHYLTEVLRIKPDDGMAHKLLGLCYGAQDRWALAGPHLDRAVALLPEDEEARYWRGRCLFELGKYAQAIGDFREVLRIRPGMLKAYDNLGLCYDRLSRFDLAMENYRQAIKLDRLQNSHYVWPYVNLASLLNHFHHYNDVVMLLEPVAKWESRSAAVYYHLGRARLGLRQFELAEGNLSLASRLDPSLALPHYQLAQLYRQENKPGKFREQIEIFSSLAVPSEANRSLY
jgi:tetratricopeptide (TPR) repeat protein